MFLLDHFIFGKNNLGAARSSLLRIESIMDYPLYSPGLSTETAMHF